MKKTWTLHFFEKRWSHIALGIVYAGQSPYRYTKLWSKSLQYAVSIPAVSDPGTNVHFWSQNYSWWDDTTFFKERNRHFVNKVWHRNFLRMDSYGHENFNATQSPYRSTEQGGTIVKQVARALLTTGLSTNSWCWSHNFSMIVGLLFRRKVKLLFFQTENYSSIFWKIRVVTPWNELARYYTYEGLLPYADWSL